MDNTKETLGNYVLRVLGMNDDKAYYNFNEELSGMDASIDWRQKCIDQFKLKRIPSDWQNDHLSKLSSSNNITWKRYFDARTRWKYNAALENVSDKKDVHINVDYRHEESEGRSVYDTNFLQKELEKELKKEAKELNHQEWVYHTIPTVLDSNWDSDVLRSGIYRSRVFSPYALPRGIELLHQFHRQKTLGTDEFHCIWKFKLLRFDGPNGDAVQHKLAKHWPAGWNYPEPRYDAKNEMEYLCSNRLQGPPNDSAKGHNWIAVESIDASNLNPATVMRLRRWIFGSHRTREILTDHSLLRLLFASCGSPNFRPIKGDVGYRWVPSGGTLEEMVAEGLNQEGISWLEYQAREASGALRPQDMYYEPYDLLEAKGKWGTQILDAKERFNLNYNYYDANHKDEDFREVPWLMWDKAGRGNFGQPDGTNTSNVVLMMKIMEVL
mmetsp:Transcript_2831/g.5895  ORF Transcript_2831/g.5895 Transcript_2831/m.5895 type:complete len:439 (-) Transcript_2831:102-1418(-)|eukprot:CAMPEP_0194331530 /NCGR_PEP_ID=MMETSP0171-20130528/55860_1 /TAXON_ID=218684 /ORGANISM="Corethron pennatum, Strain L29A3" /LENGTH=438 /DNA_ID=CAMNT_0039093035 /DNA_START=35 /DNA_END=1351 /DNA_ORIENTATION=+